MNNLPLLRLKKNEDRRLRAGHAWVYSNEIDITSTPLKQFSIGEEVTVVASNGSVLGNAYINPHSLITARLFSRDKHSRLSVEFFCERLTTALALRQALFAKPFYRLVFGDSDFFPGVVIDRFDQTCVVQITTAGMEAKKSLLLDAIRTVMPDLTTIIFRNDSSARLAEQLPLYVDVAFGTAPEKMLLEENHCQFYAPLLEGQKTGWFYDHRLNRQRLVDYVKDKRVLDVFSYLGAWGIQAAHLGAREVLCVDASALSKTWITENAALNHLANVEVMTDDAFVALKQLLANKQLFDVIILDPPAFVKKQKDKKEGSIAYQRINELALKLLPPGGILITCSCSMHMSDDDFLQLIRRAGLQTNSELQLLERGHQAPDHPVHIAIPETNYLKMIIAVKAR